MITLASLAAIGACRSASPAGPTSPAATSAAGAPASGYTLVWNDEFAGNALDGSRWTARGGARRSAVNTPDAVTVADGILTITTYTEAGTHYTGFIDTAGTYEPVAGYLEARIRFVPTAGEWGAFWLQSPTMGNPVGNAALAGTEIDIAEHRARDQAGADITNTYVMNLHWDGYGASHQTAGATSKPPASGVPLAGNWHVYALLWTPDAYVFYLDGVEQWRSSDGLSARGEYIRLTCEVLDRGWAGSIPAAGYGSRTASTTRMQVDWVRVWQASGAGPRGLKTPGYIGTWGPGR
jgi:beta-glucanase (GH16 family)